MRKIRTALILLIAAVLLSGCSPKPPERTTLGVIAALPSEIDILKDAVENPEYEVIAETEYVLGSIGNYDVVLMQCGMGLVSAALGTQAMITAFHPDIIINTGCAGALSQELCVGDVVLADRTVEWNLDLEALGYPKGYVSALDRVEMQTDTRLTDLICGVIGDRETLYRGMIVSADQFVSRNEQRNQIRTEFPDALCTEMEGAAVGHVCVQNAVPFCVIRTMSDNANGDSGVDYATFSVAAGEKSAAYLLEMMQNTTY